MKFSSVMLETQKKLETLGHEVTIPKGMERFLNTSLEIETADIKIENDYIRHYHGKIVEADAILVLNLTKNGVENYIGGNTLMELGFAHVMNKKIFLFNPIPEMSYSDEIIAVQPIIINGDLEKI